MSTKSYLRMSQNIDTGKSAPLKVHLIRFLENLYFSLNCFLFFKKSLNYIFFSSEENFILVLKKTSCKTNPR